MKENTGKEIEDGGLQLAKISRSHLLSLIPNLVQVVGKQRDRRKERRDSTLAVCNPPAYFRIAGQNFTHMALTWSIQPELGRDQQ